MQASRVSQSAWDGQNQLLFLIPVSSKKGLFQPVSFLNDTERQLHHISYQCTQQKKQVPGFFIPSVFH